MGEQTSTDGASSPATTAARADDEGGPVIGVVELQNERLTIRSSGRGPRFDVADLDGRLLSRGLDSTELAVRHAELYEIYRASYARRSDDAPFLDARRDLPSVADPDHVR